MADGMPVGELFAEIALWAQRCGADALNKLPGVWKGATDRFEVQINGHNREIESIPPFHASVVAIGGFMPVALIGPFGGMVMHSPKPDENEGALIEHFRAAARPATAQEG